MYTDGVNEAFSKEDEQFCEERLKAILDNSSNMTPDETIANVQKSLKEFSRDHEQSDDITILAIHFKQTEKG